MVAPLEQSWAAHWSRGPQDIAERFNRLDADDVRPLLEALGLSVRGTPHNLGSVENRVFRCEVGGRDPIVLKLYRPHRWSLGGLQEEHQFVQELLADGLPVVRPIRVGPHEGVGTWAGIHYALFEFAPGRTNRPGVWDEEALHGLGRLAARIHTVGRRRTAEHRMRLDPRRMGLENLRFVEQGGLMPDDLLEQYSTIAQRVTESATPLLDDLPFIRLHGDFGIHNLIPTPRGPVVVDFDDFMVGPAAFDLCWLHVGLTTPWGSPVEDDAVRDRTTRLLVDGYCEVSPLVGDQVRRVDPLQTIDALRALRMLWNDAWKRARLHDARFRAVRHAIRTREFWISRLDVLRALADRLGAD